MKKVNNVFKQQRTFKAEEREYSNAQYLIPSNWKDEAMGILDTKELSVYIRYVLEEEFSFNAENELLRLVIDNKTSALMLFEILSIAQHIGLTVAIVNNYTDTGYMVIE